MFTLTYTKKEYDINRQPYNTEQVTEEFNTEKSADRRMKRLQAQSRYGALSTVYKNFELK